MGENVFDKDIVTPLKRESNPVCKLLNCIFRASLLKLKFASPDNWMNKKQNATGLL